MQQKENRVWSLAEKVIFRCCFIFILLSILTFPFPYQLLPDTGTIFSALSEWLVTWTGKHLWMLRRVFGVRITSDSTSMYIHILNVAVSSVMGTIVWSLADRKRYHYDS